MAKFDETKPYIFISYAHKDSVRVKDIMGRLRNEGYNIWYDGGIDPGTEWDENIAAHIKNCAYFIAFISGNYIASKNCKDELNYARDLDKSQLLVYLEDVSLPDGMAMRMNRLQAIWWEKYEDKECAFEKLFGAKGIQVAHENITFTEKLPDSAESKEEKTQKPPHWAIGIIGLLLVLIVLMLVLIIRREPVGDRNTEDTNALDMEKESNKQEVYRQNLNYSVLDTEEGQVLVEYADVICDFYVAAEECSAIIDSARVSRDDIVFYIKMLKNEAEREDITVGICLYGEQDISCRKLYPIHLSKYAKGEMTYRISIPIVDEGVGRVNKIHIYAMDGQDMLYSEIIDNAANPGATIQIMQDYSSGSAYDSSVRLVLGNFRTEPVDGNTDFVYLYASGNVCQNDNQSVAWFSDLECFDEDGHLIEYNVDGNYRLAFTSPGYEKDGDNAGVVPLSVFPYVNPSEMETQTEGLRVLIPANTRVINVRAYDKEEK
ncbi:MAG: toll/interleukin-1 receptor domain-containing protein [Lachnospiraceae bacterium]